ncbi:MAG: DUF3052 domain-containing protein [Gemmatimonadota bacterium]|nr:DUF3052 domain-containing protein [Gemmatimonadota bacterium]
MNRPARTAGYSGTPLVAKLGLKAGARMQLVSAPAAFGDTIGPLPDGVKPVTRGTLDFAMLFVRGTSELKKGFPRLRDRLESNGVLWVAWPKKASGVETDVSENIVRSIGLEAGLVDVKVCAVDETWSGLKFVRRLRDR